MKKAQGAIVQQWGILVNGLTAEPAIWGNEVQKIKVLVEE
jgi:hypothetical protein